MAEMKKQQETELQENERSQQVTKDKEHRHHHHHHHRDPRKRFKISGDEYTVNYLMSPLPKRVMQVAVAAVIVALAIFFYVKLKDALDYPIAGASTLQTIAHILRGAGECTLLWCVVWGMSVWRYCPKWLFFTVIATNAIYHLMAAAGYVGIDDAASYTSLCMWIYTIVSIVLIAEIFMTFTGRINLTMLIFLLSITSGIALLYASDDATYWIIQAVNKVTAGGFVFLLYSHLQTKDSKKNIFK